MKDDDPAEGSGARVGEDDVGAPCCRSRWRRVESYPPPQPTLKGGGDSDLEDLRRLPLPQEELKFIIQFQATHKDNYGDTLTQSQLLPVARSVYGTMRFAYPMAKTSYHDHERGIFTVLVQGLPATYQAWADQGHWPHISASLLGNFWTVILVAEVGMRCETALAGLDSIGLSTYAGTGSE
jgi:hypothetical protein